MKILMLGWELPPHNSGGLGVACFQLCKALSRSGADIEFVLPYTAAHDAQFMTITAVHPQGVEAIQRSGTAYDSARYHYTDGHHETVSIFEQQLRYEQSVSDHFGDGEVAHDVIHAHDWLTFRAALRLKERTGLPLIVHVHSVERDRAGGGFGNALVREIEAMAFHLADSIVAVSNHTKAMIAEDYDIPADKIAVVHNSIDQDMVVPLDADNAYRYLTMLKQQGYRVVTNIGRLTVQKNLVQLLHAAKEVIARAPKTMFLIVGDGDQYIELITTAAKLGISKNVLFTGFQRGKAWRDAYAIGDLFVMPSISEPFGLVALEAIGYGCPVLVSKQSGVAEVIRNSLQVDFWDVHELANQITAVVQHDTLRDELYKGAQREYQHLSWDKPAERLRKLYAKHAVGVAA